MYYEAEGVSLLFPKEYHILYLEEKKLNFKSHILSYIFSLLVNHVIQSHQILLPVTTILKIFI